LSVAVGGGAPNGASFFSSISQNGRYVAFESIADDLIRNDGNEFKDIFVRRSA